MVHSLRGYLYFNRHFLFIYFMFCPMAFWGWLAFLFTACQLFQ
jgi:hypothetical protein